MGTMSSNDSKILVSIPLSITDVSQTIQKEKKMNSSSKKLFKLLIDTERVADQVLQNKQEILELDKRRQTNRVAIRDLGKNEDTKVWITIGPILVKMSKGKAIDLLKKDQQTIDVETNKLRSDQKELVAELRQLECQEPLTGFNLKPLNRKELAALSQNIPDF